MTINQANYFIKSFKFIKYIITPFSLLVAIYSFITTIIFLFFSNITTMEAKVKKINFSNNKYQPIIEYIVNEKEYTYSPHLRISENHFQVNQKIEILYNKNNPKDARINSFTYLWVPTILSLVVGVGLYLIFFILSRQATKRLKM